MGPIFISREWVPSSSSMRTVVTFVSSRGRLPADPQPRGTAGSAARDHGDISPRHGSGLPRFVGGAVGYFGYDIVQTFEEPSLPTKGTPRYSGLCIPLDRDAAHLRQRVAKDQGRGQCPCQVPSERDIRAAYRDATGRIEAMIARIRRPLRRTKPRRRRKPIRFHGAT